MNQKSTARSPHSLGWAWIPLALTVLLGFATLFSAPPIRNAVDFTAVPDARLERSLGYTLLGPVSSMFDAMTLFGKEQIIGFTLWAIGLYIVARLVWRRPVGARREAIYGVVAFILLLVIYAAAVILPRPMAKLVKMRDDVIAVDRGFP